MSSKQSLLPSQHCIHPGAAPENEGRSANAASTVPAVLTATRFAIQREARLGIQHSPYAIAQHQRIAALTQRQASSAPPLVEDEESPAAQMQTRNGTALAQREADAPADTKIVGSEAVSQRVIQKQGIWDTTKWLAGRTASAIGFIGGAVYGGVSGAVSGALSGEGIGRGAARGLVSGASLGYQRPGAALGALAGGIAGHAVGAVGAVGGGAAGLAAGLYQGGSVGAALAGAAAGAAGGYYLPVAGGAAAGAMLGEAVNEQVAPSLEPRGREDDGFDDNGVDTEGADAEQGHAIAATQFDEALQGREMPLSDYIAMREREIGDSPIIQMAAPFGGSSTNTYHVGLTGQTHTVTYNRVGQGGIDFDNPHSVTPAFGTPIQNNGDSVNILFKYKGIDYIDIKPKGKYVYTWAANKHARRLHFRAANLMKGYGGSGQPYGGWTWHHQAPSVSPRGTMVPVLTDVHKRHNHNGGVFLW